MPTASKNYTELCKQLPDLEEHIKKDEIRVIPLPKNSKKPYVTNWNNRAYSLTESFTYTNKGGKQTQKGLKYHNGNYGILIGYGNKKNGYSIGCIDIDGYTLNTNDKDEKARVKRETQQLIYDALKDLPNSLQVQTQSGGYHIYFWTQATQPDTSITSNSLYFPQDFKIKKLAGKCLLNSIEIFTNQDKKQCVLPSSTIFNKATRQKREYKVISTVNKFSDIEVLDDLNQTVINHLTSKGYTYKKTTKNSSNNNPTKRKQHSNNNSNNNSNNDDKLKQLKQTQINKLVNLITPVFRILDGGNKKHTGAMYLGGYFSYHIKKKSAVKIANRIVKEIGDLMNNTQDFKHTVLQNYDEKERLKGGLPKFTELVLSIDKTFNSTKFSDEIQSICNSNFTKEIVGDITVNKNQIPIYLYEDSKTKWLKYKEFLPKTDLILNLNYHIGQFTETNTEKEITSFKFKFENNYFNITNQVKNTVKGILKTQDLELPKYFTEMVRTSINRLDKYMLTPKEESKEETLKKLLIKRANIDYARKELGNYLHQHGTVLRRGVNNPYIVNKYNGYDSVETDDILEYLYNTGDFEINSISTDDITKALAFISDRIKPSYNIVKFPNCLYDIGNFTVIETPEKPILTLTEVQYNYNPEAKGKVIVEFLETSLKQPDDTDEQVQERVQGFYEMIGYLLTSGNPLNAWFILTGKAGAGKGTAGNIITSIFGAEKIGRLQLQELTPDNNFATSHLERKQVNIVSDSPTQPIEDKGLLKSITGFDDIPIEHKGQDKKILPKEEVPDMVTICNNIPRFKDGFDDTIVQRAIIFHFPNQFRGTDDQNKNLLSEIVDNPEEMEFLLYQSIQAYKNMVQSGNDFKARIDETKTLELLNRNTNPVDSILQDIIKYNENAEDDGEEPILRDELNKLIVFIADKEGVNLPNLKNGLIKPKILVNAVRREFGLDNEYKVKPLQTIYNPATQKYEYERGFPNFCKTEKYDEYLNEMEGNDKD